MSFSSFAFADDFQQWKQLQAGSVQQQKQAFKKYKDERDKDFSAFLKTQWKEVDILKGEVRDEQPKPDVMPIAPPVTRSDPQPDPQSESKVLRKPSVVLPVSEIPAVKPEPETEPFKPKLPYIDATGESLQFEFYGKQIMLYYDASLARPLDRGVDKHVISDYWSNLSQADFEKLVTQLERWKKELQLNDWAYVLLLNRFALEVNNNRRNEAALLSWFLLIKSSYRARLAYDHSAIYLLLPSQHEMFDVLYFTYDRTRYYVVEPDGVKVNPGRVFTYDGEYPRANRFLDMRVTSDVAAGEASQRRFLTFQFEGETYNIEVTYDRERIRFFETYPQLDLGLYFSSGVYRATATPLQQQLAESMRGMSELKAVNFLLRFTQTALQYETDDQQFGRENYLFPEETIFYPYSDCEDRAVLFAWLVSTLLGLEVVGLDYPGHVATAVHFNSKINGDSISFQGKRYVVTDPTYINARAGMSMPQFKKYSPTVVEY
jgi:hypothetical protein